MPTYLSPINLTQNELQNARIQNLATAPSSPVEGQVYFNSVDKKFWYWDGTVWQAGSGATGTAGGDLSGTYPNPSVAAGAITNAKVAAGAAIALSKLATDPLARANHTGTQLAATISDFDTQVRTSRLDQMAAPTATVSLNSHLLTNVSNPVSAQDAATKAYVDALRMGLDVKDSVRAATTADITLSGAQTIDGVSVVANDRVLVKVQTDPTENGLYVASAGAWARAGDADVNAEVTPGMFTFVEEGTVHADSGWILTTDGTIDLGVTSLAFTQFSGAGQITAGAGLTKTGSSLDVVGTTNRISVAADAVDISTSYVGQASITTLGTVATGTWQGDPVDIAYGGTGAATAFDGRVALGATGKYTTTNGGTSTDVITHSLDTSDVVVAVRDIASGLIVNVDAYVTDADTVTIQYGAAPTVGTLALTVIG